MKTIGLDIGDVWVGIAISDALGITCRPHSTVQLEELYTKLSELLTQEQVNTIVVGYPLTMKGELSEQTKKVIAQKEALEQKFAGACFALWDERLSSKRAKQTQGKDARTKEGKLQEHAIAASFILQSYLDAKAFG